MIPRKGELVCGKVEYQALWDTAAGTSVINQRIVDECGLKSLRRSKLRSVSGVQKTEIYLVNVNLPNSIEFYEIPAIRGDFSYGRWDMIVGMDIIAFGDLSVKNISSKTEWSFSVPTPEGA